MLLHSFVNAPGAVPRTTPLTRSALRSLGVAMVAGYAWWNIAWLSQWRVPPSLLVGLTGLPCPTTGCTRSTLALLRGDVLASLYFNPMTLPITAVIAATLFCLARQAWQRQRLALPAMLCRAWLCVLGVAWVIKLLSPRETW